MQYKTLNIDLWTWTLAPSLHQMIGELEVDGDYSTFRATLDVQEFVLRQLHIYEHVQCNYRF